jgi:hypothetical protein
MRLAKIFMSTITAALTMAASYSVACAADHRGVVLEAVNGGGYTYMNIDENGDRFWIAGPETSVSKGAEVSFSEQLWMPNFTSKALGRTFDKILFVSGVDDGSTADDSVDPTAPVEDVAIDEVVTSTDLLAEEAAAEDAASDEAASEEESMDEEEDAPVAPADGIYTIEQLYDRADALKGEIIKVRGKVVKVSDNIMGRTWVHIQDGTGTKGKNKLVFRSANDTAKLGDTVVAEGTLDTDKDFGYGYYYSLIVEDATFTEEPAVTEVPAAPTTPVVK